MKNTTRTSRREFINKAGVLTAGITLEASSLNSSARVTGADDKIRVGFIGIGNRGSQLLNLFMKQPDVEIAALCDIYEPYLLRDRVKVDPRVVNLCHFTISESHTSYRCPGCI